MPPSCVLHYSLPAKMDTAIAHFYCDAAGKLHWHSLDQHLDDVTQRAAAFARAFGNEDWAEYLGALHDLGKFHPDWQRYIHAQASTNGNTALSRPRHSGVGAIAAWEGAHQCPPARVLAYCIAGHHAGLDNWYGGLQDRLNSMDEQTLYRVVAELPSAQTYLLKKLPSSAPPFAGTQDYEQAHLWVRMLFSCLVDADFLDTEAFMQPGRASVRGDYPSLEELKKRYDQFMAEKETTAPDTPLNRLRKQIRQMCIEYASEKPGFFSLVVPTGGGKTLASIGFALAHALAHGMERIIIAIPYTSIIEQTSAVLRYGTDDPEEIKRRIESGQVLFGEDAVIEHHSNLNPDRETERSRLASENWDAPIIVTTNVQLFESLFATKPSTCRKLHNLARSVIILDEAQMLPPEHLRPILSALHGLVKYFGVSVVLMTATLPVLEGTIGSAPAAIQGLPRAVQLIKEPDKLAQDFQRYRQLELQFVSQLTWEQVRDQLCQHEQVLAIVNSRKDCRDLHALMPEGTVHLSALMCPADRSRVLARVKHALRTKEPIRVISTQLVEAGVDIDFPVVYRALAGLDSIAQAAGRCNREGKRERGLLVVFSPPRRAPVGLLRKGEDATGELMRTHPTLELTPSMFERYFRMFYRRVNTFDKARFEVHLVSESSQFIFAFREFAEQFSLIEDGAQESVIVRYRDPDFPEHSNEHLLERLARGDVDRQLLRRLQRYSVTLYRTEIEYAAQRGYITRCNGYWVQEVEHFYAPGIGVQLDDRFDYVV